MPYDDVLPPLTGRPYSEVVREHQQFCAMAIGRVGDAAVSVLDRFVPIAIEASKSPDERAVNALLGPAYALGMAVATAVGQHEARCERAKRNYWLGYPGHYHHFNDRKRL